MACMDDCAAAIRRAGYKATPQRLMVASALRHAGGHVSAGDVVERVRAENPAVDISTVYRTLDLLTRARLATSTDMGRGDAMYEWAGGDDPHHHLICIHCGPVAELPHSYLTPVEAAIEDGYDFAPDLSHFAIFGVCGACQPDAEEAGV